MSRESRATDEMRAAALRNDLHRYRREADADTEFSDVVANGMTHDVGYPPEGHGYPEQD
ncbi:hypothetical protein ACH4FX_12270 [Streptomyces sp. NPDC018019]|uniref:hypothetical protein n=1 Tax=Streptomyces sp. NPDC018019 TaxID=3365030 RepID=UPI0037ABF369